MKKLREGQLEQELVNYEGFDPNSCALISAKEKQGFEMDLCSLFSSLYCMSIEILNKSQNFH